MSDFRPIAPDVWKGTVISDDERSAFEVIAALGDDRGGWVSEAAGTARQVLEDAGSPPELTVIVGHPLEVIGGVGVKVRLLMFDPEDDREKTVTAWVRQDLITDTSTVPAAYLAEAELLVKYPILVTARITMVDSTDSTVTVELFSKTDQYEVCIPERFVLDPGLTVSGPEIQRRQALYQTLRREFGAQE